MPAAKQGTTADTFSFHCTACGRCCNSAPAMTVDELFHHERRFVGCLALRREAGGALALATQGHDYPSRGACPALDEAGLCSVHADGKPGMCAVVPLDPRLPEGLQRVVLRQRVAESRWMAADCLASEARATHAPLVDGERIVDAEFAAAFERHRVALDAEPARWGQAVMAWMRPELARLPAPRAGGYLALSMVPVLVVLSQAGAAQQARCVAYARSQMRLIEANVDAALRRRVAADRPFTEELRRFAAQYAAFVGATPAG